MRINDEAFDAIPFSQRTKGTLKCTRTDYVLDLKATRQGRSFYSEFRFHRAPFDDVNRCYRDPELPDGSEDFPFEREVLNAECDVVLGFVDVERGDAVHPENVAAQRHAPVVELQEIISALPDARGGNTVVVEPGERAGIEALRKG